MPEHVNHPIVQSLIGFIEDDVILWLCFEDAEKCCEHFDVSLMQFRLLLSARGTCGQLHQATKNGVNL
jgi:hypothetical protein